MKRQPWILRDKLAVLAAIALVVGGLFLQFTTYLNHDIGWILYSADQMLDGAIFGKDIVAANPPLAWYIATPSVWLQRLVPLETASIFRGSVALGTLTILWWTVSLLGRLRSGPKRHMGLVGLTGLYAFFWGCYRDFGQRDFLILAFLLPYIALGCLRLAEQRPSFRQTLLAGVLGGLAVALKPHYLAVPLAVELTGALLSRNARFSLRSEVLISGALLACYALALPVIAPAYVFEVVPAVRQIYWGFDRPMAQLIVGHGVEFLGLTALVGLAFTDRRYGPTPRVLASASVGFFVAYLAQHKGYSYHAFPFWAMSMLATAWLLERTLRDSDRTGRVQAFRGASLGIVLLALTVTTSHRTVQWYAAYNRLRPTAGRSADEPRESPAVIDGLIALLTDRAEPTSVLALSTHPFPGFPTVLYAHADWTSRTNSRIFVPAIARMRADHIPSQDPRRRFAEGMEREYVLDDLARKPHFVLVDAFPKQHGVRDPSFDLLAFYGEDPRFAKHWRAYRELPRIGTIRVFERDGMKR